MAKKERTIKDIGEELKNVIAEGINTRAQLMEALPLIIELKERLAWAQAKVKDHASLIKIGETLAGDYARKHQSVFDEGLIVNGNESMGGDIVTEDATYHFCLGYGAPTREDGQKMTQSFLAGLPDGYTVSTLKLDVAGFKARGITEEDINKAGLYYPEKYTWTRKERPEGDEE